MPEFLEASVDKFTFKVATDRYYTSDGVWARWDGEQVHIGLTDYTQQRSGDIAFAEIRPEGTQLRVGDEIAVIETIKVNISLPSPVSGKIARVNPEMESTPELINQDPYGKGWLAILEASDWEANRETLMEAPAYFQWMKSQAEAEAK